MGLDVSKIGNFVRKINPDNLRKAVEKSGIKEKAAQIPTKLGELKNNVDGSKLAEALKGYTIKAGQFANSATGKIKTAVRKSGIEERITKASGNIADKVSSFFKK